MKNALIAAMLPIALSACTIIPPAPPPLAGGPAAVPTQAPTAPPPSSYPAPRPGVSMLYWAAIGQRINVGGPEVTPLLVLEDSRCAVDVQCVWAGRVRIRATVHLGSGDTTLDLTSGEPVQVADGTLELVEVLPEKRQDAEAAPGGYRFGFRFMGGM